MTGTVMAIGAGVLTLGGATLLYLASPHQQLVRRSLPRPVVGSAGGFALLLALALLFGVAGRAAAVFIWCTLAMLVWSVVPLGAAWLRRPIGDAA